MSKEEKKTNYHLLFDEDTGELTPKTEKILRAIFDNFDKDKDDFATATNGRPFEDSVIDEIIESFEVDDNNNLLFSGFIKCITCKQFLNQKKH
ncbi:unnamed protein product [Rhizopus microsporus]